MKSICQSNLIRYYNDNLVARYQDRNTKEIYSQGKRVDKDCPLTKAERAIYVKEGFKVTVKYLMENRKISCSSARFLLSSVTHANFMIRTFTLEKRDWDKVYKEDKIGGK